MATIKGTKKQARKRHRQSLERRMRNKSVRSMWVGGVEFSTAIRPPVTSPG